MASFLALLLAFVVSLVYAHPAPASLAVGTPYIRGVNLGGWLVLEPFLTPELFTAEGVIDQWTFDQQPGSAAILKDHWDTYCTQDDVQKLASYGVNAVRIGIGFWAYDNVGTSYHAGADAYLSKAIGWARDAGLLVVIDLHGAPGSQNNAAGSGHVGAWTWQTGAGNLDRTTSVLETIARKYATAELANTVVAIELVNEPTNTAPNTLTITKEWTKSAYAAVRAAATNKNLRIAMHDQWVTPKNWLDVNTALNGPNPDSFVMDLHQYQIFTDRDRSLDQAGHIQEVCKFATEQIEVAQNNGMPVQIGEWSGNTFICVNPDGTTFADPTGLGHACKVTGCQCVTDGGITVDEWSDALTQQVRRYVEAQLYTYEEHAGGWFFWNFKGPGSWGFMAGVEKGFIPQPLTSRHYPNPCS